jgi:hypothetical protein
MDSKSTGETILKLMSCSLLNFKCLLDYVQLLKELTRINGNIGKDFRAE